MNDVVRYVEAEDLEKLTLEELQIKASSYGKMCLREMKCGWYCSIDFATIKGIELEATSEFNHTAPHEAIALAIVRAQEIRKQFK